MYVRHFFLAVSLASVVAGCSQAPEYKRPELAIPSQWPVRGDGVDRGRLPTQLGWRQFFRDPRLQGLIIAGLDYNHDMRAAVVRVEEARAAYGISKADQLPSLSLNATRSVSGTPPSVTGGPGETQYTRTDLINSLSYEVDFWGRIASLSEAAKANLLATEESRRSIRLTLIGAVANIYFNMLEMEETLSLAKATVLNREMVLAIVNQAVTHGAAARLDVLQAESALESARSSVPLIEAQLASANNMLRMLVGRTREGLPLGLGLDGQQMNDAFSVGLPSDVLLARPDVISAEQRLVAANANIGAARAAFFPKMALTMGLGIASRSLWALFAPGSRTWNFQPTIATPVFDGGRAEGNLDLAVIRQNLAVIEYERAIQQAFREVADLLASRESLIEQLRSAEATLKVQEGRFIVAEARFKVGAASYIEVLDALRDRYAAQRTLIQTRRGQLSTTAQLYKALGGGDLEETTSTMRLP
jgi:multidrug efflux system outer membrane protein